MLVKKQGLLVLVTVAVDVSHAFGKAVHELMACTLTDHALQLLARCLRKPRIQDHTQNDQVGIMNARMVGQ